MERHDELAANRRLAELLGWSGIVDVGGALLGTPPAGQPQCRAQARVPDWCGDWRDCAPLLLRYRIPVAPLPAGALVDGRWWLPARDCAGAEGGVRAAIVAAVTGRLEACRMDDRRADAPACAAAPFPGAECDQRREGE